MQDKSLNEVLHLAEKGMTQLGTQETWCKISHLLLDVIL